MQILFPKDIFFFKVANHIPFQKGAHSGLKLPDCVLLVLFDTMSTFPVRCPCNSVIGNKIVLYQQMEAEGMSPKDILKSLDVVKMCCRTQFMCFVDTDECAMENKAKYDYGNAVSGKETEKV